MTPKTGPSRAPTEPRKYVMANGELYIFHGRHTSERIEAMTMPREKVMWRGKRFAKSYPGDTALAMMLTPMVANRNSAAPTMMRIRLCDAASRSVGSVNTGPYRVVPAMVETATTAANTPPLTGRPQKFPHVTDRAWGENRLK